MTSEWALAAGAATAVIAVVGLIIGHMVYVAREVATAKATAAAGIDAAKDAAIRQAGLLRDVHDRDFAEMRRDTNARIIEVARDVDALERSTVRKDELTKFEQRHAETIAHLDRQMEAIGNRVAVLPGLQAQSEANGKMIERLLNRFEGVKP